MVSEYIGDPTDRQAAGSERGRKYLLISKQLTVISY